MTKTTELFVLTTGKSVKRDRSGGLYTMQTRLRRASDYKDILGKVVLTRNRAETLITQVGRFADTILGAQVGRFADTILRVQGVFPEDAIFEVRENSDRTEGRGTMETVAFFDSFEAAFDVARGRGVMGAGDGEIFLHANGSKSGRVFSSKAEFDSCVGVGATAPNGERLYSRHGLAGKYFHITANITEEERVACDPHYAEYLRLRAIFG